MGYIDLNDAIKILCNNDVVTESVEIRTILEDENSPITRKYQENLFKSVVEKSHVDFDKIPDSKGNIRDYIGYNQMKTVLQSIRVLAGDQKFIDTVKYVNIVDDAINNIANLSAVYEKGFARHNDFVMLEYNTYVYSCIEATSALLYSFIDYMRVPAVGVFQIKLKNTKMRANLFYFDQLLKFNRVNAGTTGTNYRKMLDNMLNNNKSNFFGIDDGLVIGAGALISVALAIVPVTRGLIYRFYKLKGAISNSLELQATFLQMNKASLETNALITADKRKDIINRQEALRKKFIKLAEDLKVKEAKASIDSTRDLNNDNKMMSIDSIRDEVSNSPIDIM